MPTNILPTPVTITADDSLNAIIAHYPQTLPVMQRFGLDTCCGGALPLRTAAQHHSLDLDELVAALRMPRLAAAQSWLAITSVALVAAGWVGVVSALPLAQSVLVAGGALQVVAAALFVVWYFSLSWDIFRPTGRKISHK